MHRSTARTWRGWTAATPIRCCMITCACWSVLTNSSVSVRIAELSEHLAAYSRPGLGPQATYELGRLLEEDTRFEDALEQYESLPGRLPASPSGPNWRSSESRC